MLASAYLAVVAFLGLSVVDWRMPEYDTAATLLPLACALSPLPIMLTAMLTRRFFRRLRESNLEGRVRLAMFGAIGVLLLFVVAGMAGAWFASREPLPVMDLYASLP